MNETLDLLAKGGPVMIPIGLASLVALTIFIERLHRLQRHRVVPQRLLSALEELVAGGRIREAVAVCRQDTSGIARILSAGLEAAGRDRAELKERMEEAGRRSSFDLERSVDAVGVVAAISPLLGLLGTVVGMIGVFRDVVHFGVGNPADLAGGIWQALITTAAGLIVAIPAYVMYRFLVARVDRLVMEMEQTALVFVERLQAPVPALPETAGAPAPAVGPGGDAAPEASP